MFIAVFGQQIGSIVKNAGLNKKRHRHQFAVDGIVFNRCIEMLMSFVSQEGSQIGEKFGENSRPDHQQIHVGSRLPALESAKTC